MDKGHTRLAWPPHSYENLYFLQERVSGHCQYATTLHGQCRGRMAFQHQHSRDSEALYSGETVRELLTHSDNDPLHTTDIFFPVEA